MPRDKTPPLEHPRPTDLEIQILSVLWDRGPAAARDVLENMPDGKTRAYTTILSTMQVMERKGLLTHTTEGKTHIFSPAIRKDAIARNMMSTIIDRIFGGNSAAAVQYLIREGDVNESELAAIRRLISDIDLDSLKDEQ